MIRQTTLKRPVTVSGRGLHTGRTTKVTLRPAPAGHGRRVSAHGGEPIEMTWSHWAPSRFSTAISLGAGTSIRTVEHMLAAMYGHGLDNVLIEVDGPEIPIFDGSSRVWCAQLRQAGLERLEAPRRAIRIRRPVQVSAYGGFLRAEPASTFSVDVTYGCLLAFPIMRWHGPVDALRFDDQLSRARSFGDLREQLGLKQAARSRPPSDPPMAPNSRDPDLPPGGAPWDEIKAGLDAIPPGTPVFRGWRPWRTALVVGRHVLPWPRYSDEPGRHVALDMIGDLALFGAPILGRVVAHDPSHSKTYGLVAAVMSNPENWEIVEG